MTSGRRMIKSSVIHLLFFISFYVHSDNREPPHFLVYTEHLPPLQMVNGENMAHGFAVDVVELMLKKNDIKAQVEVIPWGRAILMASKRPNVILFSVVKTKQRESKFHWLGKVLMDDAHLHSQFTQKSEMFAWARNDFPKTIGNTKQLLKHSTCTAMHDSLTDSIENELKWPQRSITKSLNWQVALDMFFAKRCDIFISRTEFMARFLQQKGRDMSAVKPVFSLDSVFIKPQFYFVASKATSIEWVDKLTNTLTAIQTSIEYHQLLNKWENDN